MYTSLPHYTHHKRGFPEELAGAETILRNTQPTGWVISAPTYLCGLLVTAVLGSGSSGLYLVVLGEHVIKVIRLRSLRMQSLSMAPESSLSQGFGFEWK